VGKAVGRYRLIPTVGAAAGCDLLILLLKANVKRSQPSAAPTGLRSSQTARCFGGRAVSDCYVGKKFYFFCKISLTGFRYALKIRPVLSDEANGNINDEGL
jgi:hypothetical protein